MTRLVIGAALASFYVLGAFASAQAASNPLLGRWQAEPSPADREGFYPCAAVPELDFYPTSQTMITAATKFRPVGQITTPARYFVAGPKIYVSSTAGFAGAPMYTMIGRGEMRDNTDCKYRRS